MGAPEFTFKDQKVRVVTLNGALWFVASDVLKALSMDTKQSQNYLRHLEAGEKIKVYRATLTPVKGETTRPVQVLISESGLYRLAMRSDKPRGSLRLTSAARWG